MDIYDQKKKVIHCLHSRMIYDHFQARSAKTFMAIYGSFMDIYDQNKKVIHPPFKNDL